jgi:serine/threonine protein kinase
MNCTNCGKPLASDAKFCPSCGTPVPVSAFSPIKDPRLAVIERALGNKYRILQKVGSGGFSDVYLGEHVQLSRKVAVKILLHSMGSDPEMVERFRRESKAAARLTHPNIIDIYDVGESEGVYYFVMKYIEGETLGGKMQRERKIEPGEAIDIVRQVASALAYAHENNVIHRDIKPANVMLDDFGKPVLMDFGIARLQLGENLTRTGTLMGTPHYLSPEQPLGKPVDGRSDIYSLGIMFYEMLSGRVPFHDEAAIALIYRHINEPPPPLKDQVSDLAPMLCEIVHRMIEKQPEKRFQTAHEVVEALEPLAGIYPGRATPSRKSGPGAQSTEKLRLLAGEHLKDGQFSKALDIYRMILQRNPDDEDARQKIEDLVTKQLNLVQQDISERKIESARGRLTQLQTLLPHDDRLTELRSEMDRVEQKSIKESQFDGHYTAAQKALAHDNASAAMDHLTKALTVDPENEEAQGLLRAARAAYEKNRLKAEFTSVFTEAEYHYNSGNYDLALTAIQRALDIERNQSAVGLAAKIDVAAKEKIARRAEQDQLDQQLRKADVFLRMGQIDNAREECRKILEQNPQHPGGLAKMREIENLRAQQQAAQVIQQQVLEEQQQPEPEAPSQTMQIQNPARLSPSGIIPPAPVIPVPPTEPEPPPAVTHATTSPRIREPHTPGPSMTGWIIGGVAVLVVGIAVIFLWPASKPQDVVVVPQHKTQPPVQTVTERIPVTIDTQPWTNIEISGPTLESSIRDVTPAVLDLPPGQYTVVFSNPQAGGKSVTQTIDVSKYNTKFTYPFPDMLNAEKLADTIVR